jgi:predicted ester cyclase
MTLGHPILYTGNMGVEKETEFMTDPTSATSNGNSGQNHKASILRLIEAINAGDFSLLDSLYAEGFADFSGSTFYETKSTLMRQQVAFTQFQMTPTIIIAQGDWVAWHVTYTGHFEQPLQQSDEAPIPPTHKPIRYTALIFSRFNPQGLIVEQRTTFNPMSYHLQLGILTASAAATVLQPPTDPNPVGYEVLETAALDATFTSGMEARNVAVFEESDEIPPPHRLADPYIRRAVGSVETVSAGQPDMSKVLEAAMPDAAHQRNVTVAEGDWVAVHVTISGTFTEPIPFPTRTLQPTGQHLSWDVGSLLRFNADGMIVEGWAELNPQTMLIGFGVVPPFELAAV